MTACSGELRNSTRVLHLASALKDDIYAGLKWRAGSQPDKSIHPA